VDLDEAMAYASISWERFDEAVTDELLRAVCGAFAIVAAADGDVVEEETTRFLEVLQDRSEAFPQLDMESVERLFRDLCNAILADPEAGRLHALSEIAQVKGQPAHQELVRSAAQVAVIADHRVQRNEEVILAKICTALGIDTKSS
jgi:tellurite resistance protein TerB